MLRSDRLRRNKGRAIVGLVSIHCPHLDDQDRIMVVIHVEHIVLLMSLNDLKRAIIGVLQWAEVGIMVNIHITTLPVDARLSGL